VAANLSISAVDEKRQQDDAAFVKLLSDGVKKRVVIIQSEPKPTAFDVLSGKVDDLVARIAVLEKAQK